MNAIEVKNVSYSYSKEKEILDSISFEIKEGEYVCLLGPNGSGKSTLAKIMVGLLPIKVGNIKVFDLDLNENNIQEIRKKIGIVFQNPDNQFIATSVEDDVAFGLENRNIPREKIKEIVYDSLGKVDMLDFLDKEPSMLSGGQKQRVAIAGVLALSPSILFLDEATSMLDPKGKRRILKLIDKMRLDNPNMTIVSITHDVNDAVTADRVIVLNEGKIVLNNKPDIVFENVNLLESMSLKIPFFFELKKKLINEGYNVENCKNLNDLREFLCQLK